MKILLTQTESGVKKEYVIIGRKRQFLGKTPSLTITGDLILETSSNRSWYMEHLPTTLLAELALGTAFGRSRRINQYQIFYRERNIGMISDFFYDRIMRRYELVFEKLTCVIYPLAQGSHKLLLVFAGDHQIAEIRHEIKVTDLKNNYECFLLDDYEEYEVPLILFLLYYSHLVNSNRGPLHKSGKTKELAYTHGKANQLYDPDWFSSNFPDNFAIRLDLDREEEAKWMRRAIPLRMLKECLFIGIILIGLINMVRVNPIPSIGVGIVVGIFLIIHEMKRRKRQ